jgi:prepilin-type N-terminal cleavage/methylation domain-containing protein
MRQSIALTRDSRGFTLVEMLIAIIVLAVGILAVGRMFPVGTRAQVQDRLLTGANSYAQEKLEDLSTKSWADTALSVGTHPSATGKEVLGSTNQWQRSYVVAVMAAPMDNLKKVDVTVTYSGAGLQSQRSVVATTYLRK